MRRKLLVAAGSLGAAGLAIGLAAPARADWLGDLSNPFQSALNNGSWGMALGIAFVAGLATSLTPCVYPMIGITVSVFGAREAKTKLHGAFLSTMYTLGVCTLFTTLGLTASLTSSMFGALLASLWFVVPLAILFVVMAASMFGAFEMNLPPALQNRLAQMGGLGPRGAFVLGLVGGVIAAPCTGPIITFLLGWVASTGNVALGGTMFFVYSLGLSMLTWTVGTFAITLPKSGRWLEWVKSVMGLGMLLGAVYFLRNVLLRAEIYRTTTLLAVGLGMLAVGLLIGAVHLSFHGASKLTIARKAGGIAVALAGATAIMLWFLAPPLLPDGARMAWQHSYETARDQARREGRPMMVDFGASWCGACGELDRHTFSDPRVVSEGQRFVMVRIDMSGSDALARGQEILRREYNYRGGLPFVALHDPRGEEAARLTDFVEAEQMVEMMRAVR